MLISNNEVVYKDNKYDIAVGIIFGSQNFGYDIENSDIDKLVLFYPNFKDLCFGDIGRFEIKEADNSITKCYDIRNIVKMVYNSNISDLQIFFSDRIIYNNWKEFSWLQVNRNRLLSINPYRFYYSNIGIINKRISNGTHKDLIAAMAFAQIILNVYDYLNGFTAYVKFKDESLREIRSSYSIEDISMALNSLMEKVNSNQVKEYFESYKNRVDYYTLDLIKTFICNTLLRRYKSIPE